MKMPIQRGIRMLLLIMGIRFFFIISNGYDHNLFLTGLLMIGLSTLYGLVSYSIGYGIKKIPNKEVHIAVRNIVSFIFILSFFSSFSWTLILINDESFTSHLVIPSLAFIYFYFVPIFYMKYEYDESVGKQDIFHEKDQSLFEEEDDVFEAYYKNKKY